MSEPEVKFEIDEHGRIGYRVTNEGVLLSKDEKEFIIDHITRMQEENAKLRELALELWTYAEQELLCDENCPYGDTCDWMEPTVVCVFKRRMRELGVMG